MDYELIDEKDAPENLSAMSAEAQEKLKLVRALKPGKVAKVVVPNTKEARRAFRASLTRIATNQGVKLDIWTDDTHVFVKLAPPQAAPPSA